MKRLREESEYVGVYAKKKKKCQNVKDYIKEKQASQVNEFKAFRYMGRLKSLGSLKSFI